VRLVPISDAAAVGKALETSDAVVNLAGENILGGRWTAPRSRTLIDSRVGLTSGLVAIVRKLETRPKAFISAGAVGYYGDRGEEVLDEESQAGRDWLAQMCRDWEDAAHPAADIGMRLTILRIGVVLGKGGALARMTPAFRSGLGGTFGSGAQYMPWIHMADVLDVLRCCVYEPRFYGVINCVAPHAVTNREFTRTLGRTLRRPTLGRVPAFILRAYYGQGAQSVLNSHNVAPERLKALEFQFSFPGLSSALEDLLLSTRP
jgi:uncharacterized protein (TIGR01777 family)